VRWLLSIVFVSAFAQDPPLEASRHLELGTTWMTQYIPGGQASGNVELAQRAESEFMEVLRLEPNNKTALVSLASLNYLEADGATGLDEKLRRFDDAASWYEKVLAVDPQQKDAYYSLGVIDWKKWHPVWLRTREHFGMTPDVSGPLPNASVRRELMERYGLLIEHGISNLEKALQIDPGYHDAMAYMNLMIHERADLRDSLEEYRSDIALADQWVQKAIDTMRAKARAETGSRALRVPVMSPVRRVEPVYPPLAKQARIQGTVRFTAVTDEDGQVQDLQLISGHPLLVESAREAVMQWEYRPTLLNGKWPHGTRIVY
jgi:TonB family protein